MIQLYRDPADFAHGTRARYVAAKCRCDECRRANREYQAQRYAATRAGNGNPLVDAAPARAHPDVDPVDAAEARPCWWGSESGRRMLARDRHLVADAKEAA